MLLKGVFLEKFDITKQERDLTIIGAFFLTKYIKMAKLASCNRISEVSKMRDPCPWCKVYTFHEFVNAACTKYKE